ncbi:MAG: ABC transporter ATP-binding protein [Candidatus Azotimanducaceae bacterium]
MDLEQSEDKASLRDLWVITKGQRVKYLLAILAMAITNACMFSAPIVGGHAIDVITLQNFEYADQFLLSLGQSLFGEVSFIGYLWIAASVGLIITAFGGLFLYARGRLAALASESIARGVREKLYEKLQDVKLSFYDGEDTGDLVQRCSSDLETLRVFLASDIIEIGRAIMLIICVLPVLFIIHVPLALWSICLMPFLVIGAYVFFSRVKDVFLLTDESEGAMTATLQENLTGIRVVRAFARQDHEINKFGNRNAVFRDNNRRLIKLMGIYWPVSDMIAMSQIGIVLFAGAHYVMEGSLTIGDLFIFLTCEGMVIWPVRQLGRVLTDSGKAVISLGRIDHIRRAETEESGFVPSTGRALGGIRAKNLSFAFDDGKQILDGFSIDIKPGETLGIVGPPGSGKTSLIRCLLKLYPYQSGSLEIDGQEVATLNRHWLRRQIGVVLQDPFLYSRTLRENLSVGRAKASQAEIEQASREAAIYESIMEFPEGFDQRVGERGVTLSGGQRQRLALARALLKDSPVLVLDDSLSAIDTKTEQLILKALQKRKGRQTTLVIAHRLSSLAYVDRIAVIDRGRLVQLGSHEELSVAPGLYRRLCQIQGALDDQIRSDVEQYGTQSDTQS